MNDVGFSLDLLKDLLNEARRDGLSMGERGGLFAAAKVVCDDFRKHIGERMGGASYAREKVGKYQWHIGAMLGFDITNGHPKTQHVSWALGELSTLRDLMREADQLDD